MPQLTNPTLKLPRLLASAAFFGIAAYLSTAVAHAQSFDCQKAYYADEKTICQDSRLGQIDQQLASVYGRWVGTLPRDVRDQIQSNETLFVQARRRCGQNRQCIEQSYRNRIEEIQEAIREEGLDRGKRARGSDLRRPADVSPVKPERELRSGEQSAGAAAAVAPPAASEPDGSPNKPAPARPSPEAAQAPAAPSIANTPTQAEAREALRSAEREEPVETKQSKRHDRRARTRVAPASVAEGEAPSSGSKADHVKSERVPDGTRAAAAPQPKRTVPKTTPAIAASAPAPNQQGSAPAEAQPSAGSGAPQIQWVNPPPESGQR